MKKDDCKIFWKNNLTIILNVLYVEKMGICPTYVSEHNSNREKQVIILMIPNGEGWYYIEVKQLSALLRRITSKHNSDFYYLSCLQSLRTKNI